MFRNVFCMDMKRGLFHWKTMGIIVICTALLVASSFNWLMPALKGWTREELRIEFGAVDFLHNVMLFDVFKVVIVLLLSVLHTGSFCRDENTQYLRMILTRTNFYTYARSRYLSNLLVVVLTSIVSCLLAVLIFVLLGLPIISEGANGGLIANLLYYRKLAEQCPLGYVVLIGLQFGIVAAACCSIGMLFSSYQPNLFASIGGSGLVFFLAMTFSWKNSPFDVLNLVSMMCILPGGNNTPRSLMFAWGMLYPGLVIAVCCLLFERRMKWRVEHGII